MHSIGCFLRACVKSVTSPDPISIRQCRGFDMEGAFDTFRWEYKIMLMHQPRHTVTLGTEITHSGNGNAGSGA